MCSRNPLANNQPLPCSEGTFEYEGYIALSFPNNVVSMIQPCHSGLCFTDVKAHTSHILLKETIVSDIAKEISLFISTQYSRSSIEDDITYRIHIAYHSMIINLRLGFVSNTNSDVLFELSNQDGDYVLNRILPRISKLPSLLTALNSYNFILAHCRIFNRRISIEQINIAFNDVFANMAIPKFDNLFRPPNKHRSIWRYFWKKANFRYTDALMSASQYSSEIDDELAFSAYVSAVLEFMSHPSTAASSSCSESEQ